MRIILDTNVFVSGIFWKGPPYQILQAWRNRKLRLVLTPDILEEYNRVSLELSINFPEVDLFPFMDLLTVEAEVYTSVKLPQPVSVDPSDDKFLACALIANAVCIVSGDHHLLNVSGYKGLHVLTPRDFVNRYLKSKSLRT